MALVTDPLFRSHFISVTVRLVGSSFDRESQPDWAAARPSANRMSEKRTIAERENLIPQRYVNCPTRASSKPGRTGPPGNRRRIRVASDFAAGNGTCLSRNTQAIKTMRTKRPLLFVILFCFLPFSGRCEPPILPDPKLTPGDALDVTIADISVPGYTKKVRNVPEEVKRRVYAEYGILTHAPREYEVDHLIPLEIGGSNSIKNLWPQSYITQPWNAHVKDVLENRLHVLVCSGKLDLKTAQQEIAGQLDRGV